MMCEKQHSRPIVFLPSQGEPASNKLSKRADEKLNLDFYCPFFLIIYDTSNITFLASKGKKKEHARVL